MCLILICLYQEPNIGLRMACRDVPQSPGVEASELIGEK